MFSLLVLLLLPLAGRGALYTLPMPVYGTAINATHVIGAGNNGGATAVNLITGTQTAIGAPSGTVDAGQFNDGQTMYLNNLGTLSVINNANGNLAGQFGTGGATAVSRAVGIGGTNYAVLAGAAVGVQVINLANGTLSPLGGSWNLTGMQGLDAFMRPGGSTLDDIAIGLVRQTGVASSSLDIYVSESSTSYGGLIDVNRYSLPGDFSFNSAGNNIFFGTDQGILYEKPFDYSQYAIPASITNQPSGKVTTEGGSAEFKVGAKGGYLTRKTKLA